MEAIDTYQQSLAISREFGDRRGEAQALNNLGIVYQALGRREEAIDVYQRSAAAFETLRDRADEQAARDRLAVLRQTTA